ncbi:hypothetical protein CEB3_c01200 [Peptococcaceae bacterium CEB3]|nr:hypothetical protein CEB3_c01200 [Peptococcaceae bacterium CEB3]
MVDKELECHKGHIATNLKEHVINYSAIRFTTAAMGGIYWGR